MSNGFLSRLEFLDYLIQRKATGTPKELANKLNISERCLYKSISLIRTLGAPVKFCRKRNSYYYEEPGSFHFKFIRNGLTNSSAANM